MKIFRSCLLTLATFVGFYSAGQNYIDTFYFDTDGIDARVNQQSTGTNYGTDTIGKVFYDYGPPNYSSWTYYQMDLTSIPANAVVISSSLKLYALSTTNGSTQPFLADRVTSSWAENTITYASTPTVLASGSGRMTMSTSAAANSGWQTFPLTAHVQYSIENPSLNYGWRLAMAATGTADYGSVHASSEYGNSAYRPYLIVEYRISPTDTIYLDTDGFDAYVNSASTGTNYGTDTSLIVSWDTTATDYAKRFFIQADLSGIPREKVVTSAYIHMYAEAVDNSADHPIYVSPVTQSWTEGGVNWTNKPPATTLNRVFKPHAEIPSTGWHIISVKGAVQSQVSSPEKNYGWQVGLSSESGSMPTGITYASSEDPNTDRRPFVVVEYEDPMEVHANVSHCTNGNDDGSITGVVVTGGCQSYVSYGVYQISGGVLTAIETGTNLANADVTGLANGLYLYRVSDYRGTIGYRYFFIGEEGVTTNVEFDITHSGNRDTYGEDALLMYNRATGDSVTTGGEASIVSCQSGISSTYHARSLIKYVTDWDPSLEFTQADQVLLANGGCLQGASSDNDAWVSRATEQWEEEWSTWTERPNVTTTNRIYIPTTTVNGVDNRNDTIDILGFVPYWQQHPDENFGFELAMATYGQAATTYRRYGATDFMSRNLIVSFTVKPTIETTFYDSLGLGNILVNAPAGELPFTYLISYDTLPDFDSIWYSVRDSLPDGVDSVDFYQGRENTRNYTFTDLPNDHYFIGVYDNNGVMILSREVYLTPTFEVFDSTDLDVDGDTLKVKSGETSAEATMLACLPAEEAGGFEIEIVTLADDLLLGFVGVDDLFPRIAAGYLYSLDIRTTGKVYAMRADSVLDSTIVVVGDKLKFEKDENDIVAFYKYEEKFASDTIPDSLQYDLKLAVNLKGADSKALFTMFSKGTKKPKLKYSVTHTDCGDSEGSITISLPAGTLFTPVITGYAIYDEDGLVTSGSSTATISLEPGIYDLYYTYTLGVGTPIVMSYYSPFIIGYRVIWGDQTNVSALTTPNPYIKPTSMGALGIASSSNKTSQTSTHWVQFSTAKSTPPYALTYEAVRLLNATDDFPVVVFVLELPGVIISKQVYVIDETPSIVDNFMATTNPLRISFDNAGEINVYNGNTIQSTFTSTVTGDLKVGAILSKGQVHNALVSFCYPVSTYIAKTKPYLDGSFFITENDQLKFQYTGEYNQSDLIYELTDETGTVISTGSYDIDVMGGSGTLQKNADNRYMLDMGSLGAGFYLLTITNEKGEKHYLRIKN